MDGWKSLNASLLRAPLCGANNQNTSTVMVAKMTMIAFYLLTFMNRLPLSELASLNSASLSSVASTLKHLVLSNNRLEKVRDCVNTGFTG